jgi:ubiquitin carboxyl-terminal hydrolase 25/28
VDRLLGVAADPAPSASSQWPADEPESGAVNAGGTTEPVLAIEDDTSDPLGLGDEIVLRAEGVPVGLKNIGNTCHVNSLLQTIFSVIPFREQVLAQAPLLAEGNETRRSVQLVQELRKLFALMLNSRGKFVNPQGLLMLLEKTTAEDGTAKSGVLQLGHQEDVGEVALKFLDTLDAGLKAIATPVQGTESQSSEGAGRTMVERLFMGEQFQVYRSDTAKIGEGETSPFWAQILEVSWGDVYRALEHATSSTFEYDLPAQQGQDGSGGSSPGKTTAHSELWLKRCPQVFFFHLNRASYNDALKTGVKLHGQFEFEDWLYLDTFAYDLREQTEAVFI